MKISKPLGSDTLRIGIVVLESLLDTLSQELELKGAISKSSTDEFQIILNQEQTLLCQQTSTDLCIRSTVGKLPLKEQGAFLEKAMCANFLGQGTGQSVLGIDENENLLTLSLSLPYDINYKPFKLALEEFANYLSYWQEELYAFTDKMNSM